MVRSVCIVVLLAIVMSCRTSEHESNSNRLDQTTEEDSSQCVAIRGNGNWIGAHFGAFARIISEFGEVDAIAGGSSGAITAFLYESMLKGFADPDSQIRMNDVESLEFNRRARLALYFKALYGFMDHGKERINVLLAFAPHWPNDVTEFWQELESWLKNDPEILINKLAEIEVKYGLKDAVNPEFIAFLRNKNISVAFRLAQAKAAIEILGTFRVDTSDVFFRPGLINFATLVNMLSRFADFFSGRFFSAETASAFDDWIVECAKDTMPYSWNQMLTAKSKKLSSCARRFPPILDDYLKQYDEQRQQKPSLVSRADEMIGSEIPIVVGTSVLSGRSAIADYQKNLALFNEGHSIKEFKPGFTSIRFGYWGPNFNFNEQIHQSLQKMYPDDEKSKKFLNLGEATWRSALALSPAEPGLASMLKIDGSGTDDGKGQSLPLYSIGGWSDLHPVQVLRAMNCRKRIFYVTRQGGEADLAIDTLGLLGAEKQDVADLYYVDGESPEANAKKFAGLKPKGNQSSFGEAIAPAKGLGVWCTDWNNFPANNILGMAEDAYKAKLYIRGEDPNFDRSKYEFKVKNEKQPVTGCVQ